MRDLRWISDRWSPVNRRMFVEFAFWAFEGCERRAQKETGGERGIRTLDTGVSPYNGLANRRLQPLGHLSGV